MYSSIVCIIVTSGRDSMIYMQKWLRRSHMVITVRSGATAQKGSERCIRSKTKSVQTRRFLGILRVTVFGRLNRRYVVLERTDERRALITAECWNCQQRAAAGDFLVAAGGWRLGGQGAF